VWRDWPVARWDGDWALTSELLGGFEADRLLRWRADSSFAAAIVRGSFGMGLQRDQSGEELLVVGS